MKKKPVLFALFAMLSTGVIVAQQPAAIKIADGLVQGTVEGGLTFTVNGSNELLLVYYANYTD